jgi:putative oxidoreductase
MRLLEAASRMTLGWVFVHAGFDVVRHPEGRAQTAAPLLAALRSAAPVPLPDDVMLVRLNAANMVVSGAALTLGVAPRLAAASLIGSLVPTTLGGHRFWEHDDHVQRNQQRVHFNKNLGLVGGLLHLVITPRRSPSGRSPSSRSSEEDQS